jgi:hypothetical protein
MNQHATILHKFCEIDSQWTILNLDCFEASNQVEGLDASPVKSGRPIRQISLQEDSV